MEDIILLGGGGHCNSAIDVIEQQGKYRIIGILDLPENVGTTILGYPIIGVDSDIEKFSKHVKHYHITVGQIYDVSKRVHLFEFLKAHKLNLPTIVSPIAYVSKHSEILEGSIIMHHATVNAKSRIGRNCIINSKSLVEHDAEIEDHCHISTGAIINGGVSVGSKSFIGSGAVTKQYIKIPINSFIKANSLVK